MRSASEAMHRGALVASYQGFGNVGALLEALGGEWEYGARVQVVWVGAEAVQQRHFIILKRRLLCHGGVAQWWLGGDG